MEGGGVYMSTGGFLVAKEARGRLRPGNGDDVVVAASLDDFINLASVIFVDCGPGAYLRTA